MTFWSVSRFSRLRFSAKLFTAIVSNNTAAVRCVEWEGWHYVIAVDLGEAIVTASMASGSVLKILVAVEGF